MSALPPIADIRIASDHIRRSGSDSLAIFAAIRRALSLVSDKSVQWRTREDGERQQGAALTSDGVPVQLIELATVRAAERSNGGIVTRVTDSPCNV